MSGQAAAAPSPRWRTALSLVLAAVLVATLAFYLAGLVQDIGISIRSPLERDYGEGIVWEQATLIPGPRMYSVAPGLPFIVFHYPPLFYLATRAAAGLEPSLLAAGRLVSTVSMLGIPVAVAGLILLAGRRPGRRLDAATAWSAVAGAALVLCLHVVRSWGLLMRVDTLAVALSLFGVLLGTWSNGRTWCTTLSLLVCTAAVFTKQTELAAGIAVVSVAALRDLRSAVTSAVLAGAMGVAAVVWLQWLTGGGFLHNIIADNVNRFAIRHAFWVVWSERMSLPLMAVAALAFIGVALGYAWPPGRAGWTELARGWARRVRAGDAAAAARLTLLVYYGLACLALVEAFKSGGNYNYLFDWACAGGALLGIAIGDMARGGFGSARHIGLLVALVVAASFLPVRTVAPASAERLAEHDAIVRRVAAAARPVSSENMTILLEAGKHPLYEPAIVTELAALGQWNEAPLVDMIRSGGFAFMIITDDTPGGTNRRSPAVDAAMRDAYPRVEVVGPRLWARFPAAGAPGG